jgi:3-oxoacyl-[acyl-carrier-protein] synthase II
MTRPVCVSAAELVSALGPDLCAAMEAWSAGNSGLSAVPENEPGFSAEAFRPALWGRIVDRSVLKGRRYGAASNLAVHVARRAVERAGWSAAERRDAWIFAASSRGNAAELLGAHGWRRPVRRLVASNTLHSEIAAAVSIELGMEGPWQMVSNGCASGLDALGFAWRAVASGWTARALVVASELPLVPALLRDFCDAGLLARDALNDLMSPASSGFHPAEAGVALVVESEDVVRAPWCRLTGYEANSDAYDALASPPDGRGLARLLGRRLVQETPGLVCPHTTGTRSHAVSEEAACVRAWSEIPGGCPPLLPLKTLTGHALGASGLVDTALLAGAFLRGSFPGLPPCLSVPAGMRILDAPLAAERAGVVWKVASAMGGHNGVVALRAV